MMLARLGKVTNLLIMRLKELILNISPVIIIAAVTGYAVHALFLTSIPGEYSFSSDFYAYWSGYEFIASGGNPYDHNALQRFQKDNFGYSTGPIYYLPFLFVVLAPVLSLPYKLGALLWFGLNFALFAGCALFSSRLFNIKPSKGAAFILAAFFFPPLFYVFKLGQLSLFITFFCVLSIYLFSRGRDLLAGFCFCLTTLKPHYVYLLGIYLVIHTLRAKRFKFILGVSLCLISLFSLNVCLYPKSLGYFISSDNDPLVWTGISLVGLIRVLIYNATGTVVIWPAILIPLAAALVCMAAAFKSEKIGDKWIVLIAASVFTSPYLWVFDLTPLIFLYLAVFREYWRDVKNKNLIIFEIVLLNGLMCLFFLNDILDHRLFWAAPALFLIYYQAIRERRVLFNLS